ncbi:MAG: rhodanese-like domain-containing protein [Desulfovibrio sp.]
MFEFSRKLHIQTQLLTLLGATLVLSLAMYFAVSPSLPSVEDELTLERTISVQQALELHKSGKALFIDAREPFYFAEGHLPGAINIAKEMMTEEAGFNQILKTLDKDKNYIVYCDGLLCEKSRQIANVLTEKGYMMIIMPEGVDGWINADGELVMGDENGF